MVDRRYGEVWDRITVADFTPQWPKLHLWKNGYHTAEHALVGYVTTGALRAEAVILYYAFADCKIPENLRPYYYDGTVGAREDYPVPGVPGLCGIKITFSNVH